MAVVNTGAGGVYVDPAGVTLPNFTTAAASNIKIQDGTIYTITTGAVGDNATGSILLAKASGAVATLDSSHTFVCTNTQIDGGLSTDAAVSGFALSLRGAKLVMTSGAGIAELTAPLVGDSQTQVIYRSEGTTWNSVHPGTNLVGSTFVFEGGGDGHLGRNPNATVRNVNLLWRGSVASDFVLALNQGWDSTNKPSPIDGFRFISVVGNNLISLFTWMNPSIPGQIPNNYFFVCRDFTYDVAPSGQRPTALLRSYRRTSNTAQAGSFWGAVSVNPTILHIDLKTTLSASGALDSTPTYLRNVNYNVIGTVATDSTDDILALRFSPTIADVSGNRLSGVSVVVLNTNANCSSANPTGTFRARLVASGSTDATGRIVITEPSTKDYTSNASHRTDSIVIRNRTLTTAWHKWWEAGTKLIPIADSRNGTGTTAPESYAATDFRVSYRRGGVQFASEVLDMSAPRSPSIALPTDANYNAAASTTGVTVAYAGSTTTVTLAAGTYTLDQVWKAVIDFHASVANNEAETVLPFTAWTAGTMSFGTALVFAASGAATLTAGTRVTSMTAASLSIPAQITLNVVTVNGSVTQATPTNLSGVTITGTLTYNTNAATSVTFTNCTIGTLVNNGTGLVTIQQAGSTVTTYTDPEINYLDSTVTFTGCAATDSVRMRRVDNNAILLTHPISAGNTARFKVGSWLGVNVYFERVGSSGATIASTFTTANRVLTLGDNGIYELTDPASIASLAQTKAYFDTYGGAVVWNYKTQADRTVASTGSGGSSAQNDIFIATDSGVIATTADPTSYVWSFIARNPMTGAFETTASDVTAQIKRGATVIAVTMDVTFDSANNRTNASLPSGTVLQVGDVVAVSASKLIEGQTYTSPTLTSTVVSTDNSLTVANIVDGIEASTVIAKEATLTDLAADIGAPLQAVDYVIPPTSEEIAAQVEVAIITEGDGNAVLQAIADKIGNENVSATVIAAQVRAELTPELERIDAPISLSTKSIKNHVTAMNQA